MLHTILLLVAFAITSYIQNMAFTWSSRSRNSGDPNYHRYASYCSNGIYYVTNALLTIYIIHTQVWWLLAVQGIVYTLSTAEGSVYMMKQLLKREAGKRAVGASKYAQIPAEEYAALRDLVMVQGRAIMSAHEVGTILGYSGLVRDYQQKYSDCWFVPKSNQSS